MVTKLSFVSKRMGPSEIPWKQETPLTFIPNNGKNIFAFKGNMAIPFLVNDGFLGLSVLKL